MTKRKITIAALIGNVIEYFDFTLFGFFSPLFANLFFPASNPSLALLSTLGIFAASFVIRPIGGIVFGHVGDKYGRRIALSMSILLMAIATLSIALIPTYDQIGVIAPIALCLFRLLQGFSTGGEFNGALIFLIEHNHKGKAGVIGSLLLSSSAVGACLAVMCGAIALSPGMPAWLWRIPFIIGAIFGVVGLFLRLQVAESPEFIQKPADQALQYPFITVIKKDWRGILKITFAVGFGFVLINMLIVYMNVFLNKFMAIPLNKAFWMNNIAILVYAVTAPIVGALSDKIGQIIIMKFVAVMSFVLSLPIFILISTANICYILLAEIILGILAASYAGVSATYMFKMFPTRTRYSGTAFGFSLASAIFGGTAPILSTYLIQKTGNLMMPAYYIAVCSIIGFVAVLEKKRDGNYDSRAISDTPHRA
jgi:MFS transporter, MHS family, proline/betaine transporter